MIFLSVYIYLVSIRCAMLTELTFLDWFPIWTYVVWISFARMIHTCTKVFRVLLYFIFFFIMNVLANCVMFSILISMFQSLKRCRNTRGVVEISEEARIRRISRRACNGGGETSKSLISSGPLVLPPYRANVLFSYCSV